MIQPDNKYDREAKIKKDLGVSTLYFADLSTVGSSPICGRKSANNH